MMSPKVTYVQPVRTASDLTIVTYPKHLNRSRFPIKNEECSICLKGFDAGNQLKQTPCWHLYHRLCLDAWLLQKCTCPLCNTQIIMPIATPVGVQLDRESTNSEQFGVCRECQRQFYREPHLRPQTSEYFRCPDCRNVDLMATLKASCTIS